MILGKFLKKNQKNLMHLLGMEWAEKYGEKKRFVML